MRETVFLCFDILTEYVYILLGREGVMHYAAVDGCEKEKYGSYHHVHTSFCFM